MREWPKEKYGTFFSGDSYIILHTEKASPDSDVCICFQFTFLELLVSLYKLIGKIIIAAKMDTNDTNASPWFILEVNVAKFEFNFKLNGPVFDCYSLLAFKKVQQWLTDWLVLTLFFFATYTNKLIVSSYRMQAPW